MTPQSPTKWHVYRGTNSTTKEIYYGVSTDPMYRVDGSHCIGGTKTIRHWDCAAHGIKWNVVSSHDTQKEASAKAHAHEKQPVAGGYTIIQTAGI